VSASRITRVAGQVLVLPGNDVDTDRIMPARFLRAITFEGLEAHVFADDREEMAARGERHAFDDPTRADARVLLVGSNFGCGSSREHAPQALYRRGFRAIVGASFAEIFQGNALMMGLPCVSVSLEDLGALLDVARDNATATCTVDLQTRRVTLGDVTANVTLPDAAREALLSGGWDGTSLLLDAYDDVRNVAARLPYLSGF
jgi:3-isopropylmalate/(R)-2-methylmalate dehydratase small subunit